MKILRTGAALVAIAALTLTACGGGSGDTTDATGSQLSGTLQGVGASSMRAAQEVWRARFQTANPNVTINYSPDGSGAGRTAFMDGSADFAGSDRALKDEEMTMTFAKCVVGTSPINLPIYISPIAIIFNLDGVEALNLSAEVIAKIFAGQITNWHDPAIAALNDGVALPNLAITPVHRSDNSGTTENFTSTLSQVAPKIWTEKASGDWPAAFQGEGAQGTSGVVAAVQNGSGTIGYADVSGIAEGMSTVSYSLDGKADYVGPTAEDAAQIVEASEKVAGRAANDWTLELNRTAAGYPFVLVSYAIVCQEYADPAIGELVNAYVSYVASDEGQLAAVPQAGNAPLTGDLANGVRAAAATIK